tara:strand:- start:13228 stop:13677 length:450 start_codon:yes stop_codon:yes gene_type:complete
MKKSDYMREALNQAQLALKEGEVPVGTVVVKDNQIIGRGYNKSIQSKDPTAHAEIIALREAALVLNNYRLTDTIVFTTLEPCLMCAGALVHSRVSKVIFSTSDPKSGVLINNGSLIQSNFLNHRIEFEGGLLEEDSSKLLKEFFLKKRA